MGQCYGAVIMTQVTARVHPVHLTNADQRQAATDPQTRPVDLGCKFTYRLPGKKWRVLRNSRPYWVVF